MSYCERGGHVIDTDFTSSITVADAEVCFDCCTGKEWEKQLFERLDCRIQARTNTGESQS